VHECVVGSLFLSHGLRRDAVFHVVLNGAPNPPVHIKIDGKVLYDVRTDMETWQGILRKVLAGKQHPGVDRDRMSFEALLKSKVEENCSIYVLEEGGRDLKDVVFGEKPVFVLGDHVGMPKKTEAFVLRFGEKISLGKTPYLAASCITVINYTLDQKVKEVL